MCRNDSRRSRRRQIRTGRRQRPRLRIPRQPVHRHRRPRPHFSRSRGASRHDPALARHPHRRMGRMFGLLHRRHAHQRLFPHPRERDRMRRLRRRADDAHRRQPSRRRTGGHAPEPALRLILLPQDRSRRAGILRRYARPLRSPRRDDRHRPRGVAPVHVPADGQGRRRHDHRHGLFHPASGQPRDGNRGRKRHRDTRLQDDEILGVRPRHIFLRQVLRTVHRRIHQRHPHLFQREALRDMQGQAEIPRHKARRTAPCQSRRIGGGP